MKLQQRLLSWFGLLGITMTLIVGLLISLDANAVQARASATSGDDRSTAVITPTEAISMTLLGTYASPGGETAAEIVAYDSVSETMYVVNVVSATIDVIDISQPTTPTLLHQIDVTPYGAQANSVAFHADHAVAAVEAAVAQEPGQAVFFDRQGDFVYSVTVGALPDMITFTPDGNYVLVANEGEPDATDPEGSVSIIDISGGVQTAVVSTADFTAWNGREAELRAEGIRIFPGNTTAQDVEPEYIAVSADGRTAFVTLQEANAFAVVTIATATVKDILPLGLKDHSQGQPQLAQVPFTDLPVLGETPAGQTIYMGGFSGLWYEGMDVDGNYQFVTLPDRGPNGEPLDVDNDGADERPFVLPDYQARIIRFTLNPDSALITITQQISLTHAVSGTAVPLTGLPNIPGVDEEPVDLFGDPLPYDAYGADLEGIVVDGGGNFWAVDEYRPAIYQFSSDGALLHRYVPAGTGALGGLPAGTYGEETLPAEYASRVPNRGFEAVALDSDAGILYAFIQSPLANPNNATSTGSSIIRVLGINPADGQPVAEYVYLLEAPAHRDSKVDKIGDAVYAGNGAFFVIERDGSIQSYGKKYVFAMNLLGATNLLDPGAPALPAGETLEQQTADSLAALSIQPVAKRKVTNLPSIGYLSGDKAEGLTLLPDGRLVVLNDNDFGLLAEDIPLDGSAVMDPTPTPPTLGIISFPAGNGLDASDEDSAIHIQNWPVLGMFLPDGIASYEVDGRSYYLTANEGDDRGEPVRVKNLALDPTIFPDAITLQADENLGRLNVSEINGDLDGDGDYDELWAYGSRSFTIWDQFGNLVFDSGDVFEQITAVETPDLFNTDNGDPADFDTRSDNKGPEPESVVVGQVGCAMYAFIGLERAGGGVMVYDVTDPMAPVLVAYEPAAAGDISPEGLKFVPPADSPTGKALLLVANEISGTTTIYEIEATTCATYLPTIFNP